MKKAIEPIKYLRGFINLPGDKSITHRAIILGAISNGETIIKNYPDSVACNATLDCIRELGIKVEVSPQKNEVKIFGKGLYGLSKPNKILDCKGSATTFRLLTGLLTGQTFSCEITGNDSLKRRPMDRIITPLKKMGASFVLPDEQNKTCCMPLRIIGQKLNAIEYELPVPSAQVKSSILLASLYSSGGKTKIKEPIKTRDHTENLLNYFGGNVYIDSINKIVENKPVDSLNGKYIFLPGDISTAAFFVISALLLPNSHLIIRNVLANKTRFGLIKILKNMGAEINELNQRIKFNEKIIDLEVKSSQLSGIEVDKNEIVNAIDEIPILAVAALFAKGRTVISNISELKFKESNRIESIICEFRKLGADVKYENEQLIITGQTGFIKNNDIFDSHLDHRIAMSLLVTAMAMQKNIEIHNSHCIDDSFPDFYNYMDTFRLICQ